MDESPESAPVVRQSTFTQTLHPFHTGHAKMGGRQKGVKNIATPPLSGVETARKLGFDPLEVSIQIVRHGCIIELDGTTTIVETPERLKLLREVLPYVVPKVPTEIKGTVDHRHAHVDMTAIMMDPHLAEAAQTLALAMAQLEDDETPVFDVEPDHD